jgi:hypothetical protein
MKKIFLLMLTFFVIPLCFAADSQRQITKEVTSSTTVKTGKGRIYNVSMVATQDDGYVAVYDSDNGDNSSADKKVELRESDQYDSDNQSFPEGLVCETGIRVEVNDAEAIISYY